MPATRALWLLLALGGAALLAPPVLDAAAHSAPSWRQYPGDLQIATVYVAGAYAFWRRPMHPVARRLLASGSLLVLAIAVGHATSLAATRAQGEAWIPPAITLDQLLELGGGAVWVAAFAVFPDGRYRLRHERPVVIAFMLVAGLLPPALLLALPKLDPNPYFVWAPISGASPLFQPGLALLGGPLATYFDTHATFIVVGALLLGVRYRRLDDEQQLQVRWILAAGLVFVVASTVTLPLPTAWGDAAFLLTFPLIPAALVVGLLRHHLLDIDLVIRRSVVFGVLWIVVMLAYFGVAAGFGLAAGRFLPGELALLLAIVATVAFQPARGRLESLADRLVFGQRLGGYELLSQLGARLQEAGDRADMASLLAEGVRRGLRLDWARVWLRAPDGSGGLDLEPLAADGVGIGEVAAAEMVLPLVHAGELMGAVELGSRPEGPLRKAETDLLSAVARQAALAMRDRRLTAELSDRLEQINMQARELAASRNRIVQAGERERRRIERNIHDGVQQEIVAIMAKLSVARTELAGGNGAADRRLAELQDHSRSLLQHVQELARGIHPAVLGDRGLVEAVEAQASRLPIGVTIEAPRGLRETRFSDEVEGATYFIITEALANVLKHASASQATVRLAVVDGTLEVEISDNGVGFDSAAAAGSGLRGLADRVEAVGGAIQVHTQPGGGTRIAGRLPAVGRKLV